MAGVEDIAGQKGHNSVRDTYVFLLFLAHLLMTFDLWHSFTTASDNFNCRSTWYRCNRRNLKHKKRLFLQLRRCAAGQQIVDLQKLQCRVKIAMQCDIAKCCNCNLQSELAASAVCNLLSSHQSSASLLCAFAYSHLQSALSWHIFCTINDFLSMQRQIYSSTLHSFPRAKEYAKDLSTVCDAQNTIITRSKRSDWYKPRSALYVSLCQSLSWFQWRRPLELILENSADEFKLATTNVKQRSSWPTNLKRNLRHLMTAKFAHILRTEWVCICGNSFVHEVSEHSQLKIKVKQVQ